MTTSSENPQSFVIYHHSSGEIIRVVECSVAHIDIQCAPEERYIAGGADDVADYVNLDGQEPVIAAKGDYTLEALPLPCTVTIEGVEYHVTEQPTFEFNYPGTYTVLVDAGVRYLRKEFEIVWP